MAERLLPEETRKQLEQFFEDMEPIKVIAVLDKEKPTCVYCEQIEQLLKELAETSKGKIQVEFYTSKDKDIVEKYKVDDSPVIIVEGKNKGLIRYYGIPAENEFGMFVETLKEMSLGHVHLPEEVIQEISKIEKPVRIRVFVTPQCPYCPMAAITAYHMAAL
ncbi:MAG: glutaredoxin, partial [Candidatus Micrarchaeota archaeon]|nr:glutaredoxin [Candidatus Micrarchaeota archaeon]